MHAFFRRIAPLGYPRNCIGVTPTNLRKTFREVALGRQSGCIGDLPNSKLPASQ